jgi:hypothetical protein
MDRETRARIEDFFTATELVDFLCVPIEEIVDRLEDVIEENLDEVEEFIGLRRKGRE